MQTILVPTDFSPEARNATQYGAELAKMFNATLILFHAYLLPTPVSEVPYVMVTVDDLQKENELNIRREATLLAGQYAIKVECLVRIGIPSDEVKLLSEEKNVDLIVMGFKGHVGLDKMIGSTTINAVRKVNIPVVIVPHDVPYTPIKVITYASDFSYKVNGRIFEPLMSLIRSNHASLKIVHVRHEHDIPKPAEQTAKNELTQLFSEIHPQFDDTVNQSVMQGITHYMDAHPSELLVMVSHKPSLLERIFTGDQTTRMAYKTNRPLLILQESD